MLGSSSRRSPACDTWLGQKLPKTRCKTTAGAATAGRQREGAPEPLQHHWRRERDRRDPSSLRFAPGVPPVPYLGSRAPPSACRSAGSPAGSRSASCRWSAGSSCAPPRCHPGHLAERIPLGDTGHPSAVTAGRDRSHPQRQGDAGGRLGTRSRSREQLRGTRSIPAALTLLFLNPGGIKNSPGGAETQSCALCECRGAE